MLCRIIIGLYRYIREHNKRRFWIRNASSYIKEKNRGRVSWTHDFDVSFVISKLQFCLFFLMRIIFIYLFIFFLNIRTASWSRCHNVHHQHQLRLRSSNGNMKFSNSQTPNFISYAQNYISKIQYSIYIHNDVCFARVIQFPSPQKHAQSSTTFSHTNTR